MAGILNISRIWEEGGGIVVAAELPAARLGLFPETLRTRARAVVTSVKFNYFYSICYLVVAYYLLGMYNCVLYIL